VRHAAGSAFKGIKVGQVPKSRSCSREPHNLSATCGTAAALACVSQSVRCSCWKAVEPQNRAESESIYMSKLINKQIIWYRIRIFCDSRHRGNLPRRETCIARRHAGLTSSMRKWILLVPKYRACGGHQAVLTFITAINFHILRLLTNKRPRKCGRDEYPV
jgi:hypothetical protein